MFNGGKTKSQICKGNVLTPLNYFMIPGFITLIVASERALSYGHTVFAALFFIFGILLVVFIAVIFCIALRKDPQLLQSEQFRLEQTALQIKAGDEKLLKLQPIQNPHKIIATNS
jgi:hypothetical protein